jgi:chromosome partitioning protein
VILVDADKQASSAAWSASRDENGLTPRVPCVQKLGKTLHMEIRDLEKRYETVIVDCGGRDSIELRSAMLVADRFFSPIKPSQYDAWTLDNLDAILTQAQVINPELVPYMFINQANPNPRLSEIQDVREFILEFESLRLAKSVIRDRIVFRKVAQDGRAVAEMKDKKAALEIELLYEEVFNGYQTESVK